MDLSVYLVVWHDEACNLLCLITSAVIKGNILECGLQFIFCRVNFILRNLRLALIFLQQLHTYPKSPLETGIINLPHFPHYVDVIAAGTQKLMGLVLFTDLSTTHRCYEASIADRFFSLYTTTPFLTWRWYGPLAQTCHGLFAIIPNWWIWIFFPQKTRVTRAGQDPL